MRMISKEVRGVPRLVSFKFTAMTTKATRIVDVVSHRGMPPRNNLFV